MLKYARLIKMTNIFADFCSILVNFLNFIFLKHNTIYIPNTSKS